jgi:uncharacterized protein (TIRG00374 family)
MKRALQFIVALGISGLAIWLSIRNTDVSRVWNAILNADRLCIAKYVAVLVVIHFIRTIRWGLLLAPLAKPRFRDLNPLSAVGIMALMVLPLRLGEFARPLLAAEYLKVKRSAALASVVVERIVDGLVMALLLVALLWSINPNPGTGGEHLAKYRIGGALVAAAWGVGLAALIFAVWNQARAAAILRATVGRVLPGLEHRIEEMLNAFIDGLKVLPSFGKAVWFFVLTGAYWCLAGWGLKLLAPGFGLPMTAMQAFTVLGMQVIGAMIPAGPGMVGTFQLFTTYGLSFFVVEAGGNPAVVAFANTVWFLQFVQQALFGFWFIANGRVKPHAILLSVLGRSKSPDVEVDPTS